MDNMSLEKFQFNSSYSKPKPGLNQKHLRIYGHMLCPFVERAVLAMAAKQIPFQKCEMEMT